MEFARAGFVEAIKEPASKAVNPMTLSSVDLRFSVRPLAPRTIPPVSLRSPLRGERPADARLVHPEKRCREETVSGRSRHRDERLVTPYGEFASLHSSG